MVDFLVDFRFFVKAGAEEWFRGYLGYIWGIYACAVAPVHMAFEPLIWFRKGRLRGRWAVRLACGQFRILFLFLQKSAQRSPLDGQVVPSWSPGALTKCFVFYSLGTGGRWRGQLWGPVAVGGLQNSKLNLFHQN